MKIEICKPMSLSQNRVSLEIGVHPRRINEIVLGKRRITADTALRLARYFGTSPQFWRGCRMIMIWMWLPIYWEIGWTSKCGLW